MAAANNNRIVKDIIKRYGETIDLGSSPYLIVEILRQYGPKIDGGAVATCQPPGGPPKLFDPSDIIREIRAKMAEVNRLSVALQKALPPKATPRTKSTAKPAAKRAAKPAASGTTRPRATKR